MALIGNLYKAYYLLSTIALRFRCLLKSNIRLGKGMVFKLPCIIMDKEASIIIGNGCTINSSNWGYHINMHSSCKPLADRKHAMIKTGDNSRIHGTCIHAYSSISIGDNCLIAANTQIIDGNGHSLSFDNPTNRINTTDTGKTIVIEDNVWIGANCLNTWGNTYWQGSGYCSQ